VGGPDSVVEDGRRQTGAKARNGGNLPSAHNFIYPGGGVLKDRLPLAKRELVNEVGVDIVTGIKVRRAPEGCVLVGIEHDATVRAVARLGSAAAIDGVPQRVVEVKRKPFAQRMTESKRCAVV